MLSLQELTDTLDIEIGRLADDLVDKLFPLPENPGWKKGDPVKTISPRCEIQRVLNFETRSITYKIVDYESDVEESCTINPELGTAEAVTALQGLVDRFENRFV